MTVQILSLATATAPHVLKQTDVAATARRMFSGRFGQLDRMMPVFETAGIDQRQSVRPLEWFSDPHGWPERTAAYLEGATQLFIDAARAALAKGGLQASDIDAVVTVSSTGIATPSIEAQAHGRMGFRPDIVRVPVFGLGCAGGVSGLAIAARLARGRPGSKVLMVAVETCTLAFRLDELTKANIVATALFGDGAAAVILSTQGPGVAAVEGSGEHFWPDTLDIMGWNVDPQGFGVIFARAIPPFARENIGAATQAILAAQGLTFSDIGRFVCHPGGMKVIEALEEALPIGPGALVQERAVLKDHGNMSAPTALFVLERVLAERHPLPERMLLSALGPGFTASAVTLGPGR